LEEEMIALIIITTMSVITLWVLTRVVVGNGFGEDQEEPTRRKPGYNEKLASISAWIATLLRREDQSTDPDSYDPFAPPPERHPTAASYCPKCRDQFRKGFTQCNTCDVALIMYEDSQMESRIVSD
jgi:hypothetical protein